MGKRGPKAWEPTDEELAKIKLYAGLGSTQEQIAAMIGKSVDTLKKHESVCKALDEGKAETIAKVAGSLVRKALNGDTASAIFYLKTQAGWKETSVVEHAGKVKHGYDLDSLSTEKLDQLERILTDARGSAGGEGEAVASSIH